MRRSAKEEEGAKSRDRGGGASSVSAVVLRRGADLMGTVFVRLRILAASTMDFPYVLGRIACGCCRGITLPVRYDNCWRSADAAFEFLSALVRITLLAITRKRARGGNDSSVANSGGFRPSPLPRPKLSLSAPPSSSKPGSGLLVLSEPCLIALHLAPLASSG